MKIIHKEGFTKDELFNIRSIIYSNTVGSIRVLVEATQKLGIPISAENQVNSISLKIFILQGYAKKVMDENYFTGEFTPSMAKDVKTLWGDSGIQQAFSRSAEFQLNDSAE
jgi:hypothetical protein